MHGRYIKDYLLCGQFIRAVMLVPRAVHISILWAKKKICNLGEEEQELVFLITPSVPQHFSKAPFHLLGFCSDRNSGHRWDFTGANALLPWQRRPAVSLLKDPLLPRMSQGSPLHRSPHVDWPLQQKTPSIKRSHRGRGGRKVMAAVVWQTHGDITLYGFIDFFSGGNY